MATSDNDVIKAWENFVSTGTELGLETFENKDGGYSTRLFNKATNGTVAEANGPSKDGLSKKLLDHAGAPVVDLGVAPKEDPQLPVMPATNPIHNENMVMVDEKASEENPSQAVADARHDAGLPGTEGGATVFSDGTGETGDGKLKAAPAGTAAANGSKPTASTTT